MPTPPLPKKNKTSAHTSRKPGPEPPCHEIELRNRVTQNDATPPRVTNPKIFIEIPLSSSKQLTRLHKILNWTSSRRLNPYFSTSQLLSRRWKVKKLTSSLLTRRLNFYFFTFELPTQSWKIKSYTSSY